MSIQYSIMFSGSVLFNSACIHYVYHYLFNPRRAAPQGYSSCVCVCVSGSIFPNSDESARKTHGLPQLCNCLIQNELFFIKQPLRVLRNSSGSCIGTPVSHFACPRRHPSVYPFTWRYFRPRGVLLRALTFCGQRYIAHVHIFITGRWSQLSAIVRLFEERYDPI